VNDETRQLLRELVAEALAGTGNGHGAPTPQVPAPPVAAVLRPSTWSQPAAPGEVIGDVSAPAETGPRVESVKLATDDDLNRFAQFAAAHADAVRAGALRFTFGPASTTGATRVERGAVTERAINEAAKAGGRLILGPRAVLTPLARERARALKIQIEREK
jgi:hypothetical protein